MNLTRLIKLKKINGELTNLTQYETTFINLFDNLTITNLMDKKYPNIDFYINRERLAYLAYNNDTKSIQFTPMVYRLFGAYFYYVDDEIEQFLMNIINNKLGLKNIRVSHEFY